MQTHLIERSQRVELHGCKILNLTRPPPNLRNEEMSEQWKHSNPGPGQKGCESLVHIAASDGLVLARVHLEQVIHIVQTKQPLHTLVQRTQQRREPVRVAWQR